MQTALDVAQTQQRRPEPGNVSSPLRRFSNPYEGDFLRLAGNLCCRNLRGLLAKTAELAGQSGISPPAFLKAPIDDALLSTRCWTPELGAAKMAISRGITRESLPWLVAQLEVAAFQIGLASSIDVEIEGPHPLAVAGHFIHGERIRVLGGGDTLTVRSSTAREGVALRKMSSSAGAVWVAEADQLLRVGSVGQAILASDAWESHWNPAGAHSPPTLDREFDRADLEATLSAIEEYLPVYFGWIRPMLREFVLLRRCMTGTKSQSFALWPGQIQGSTSTRINNIILLIHESSHQYLNLLLWHGRLTRPEAPEVHSVLKNTRRPLEKILFGFHALGNVLLGLIELPHRGHDFDVAELESQEKENHRLVAALDTELQRAGGYLSPLGQDIYLPLRARLLTAGFLSAGGPAGEG